MELDPEGRPLLMARRLRQVVDLYIHGKVVELIDGSPLWVQTLNPFEHDTARNEAQIARARLMMAIKELGSDEQTKVRMFFFEDGVDAARGKVIDARVGESLPRIMERFRNDPDWNEKLKVLERGLEDIATAPETIEVDLLERLSEEYTTELTARLQSEREFLEIKFDSFNEEQLWDEYLDWYLARRGAEIQLAEFRLYQVMYGARWCDAVRDLETGLWDHAKCEGHLERVFQDVPSARSAPQDFIALLMEAADDLEMTVREAKNLDRQESSSDSSLLPSEAGESTVSTQEEIPPAPPGTSSSPSPTPSPSSASVS